MAQIVNYKLLYKSFDTSIGLYEKIDNLSEIHDLTQNDNFCLINAKTVYEINQILCAINKSINNKLKNKLITKRLNTEILFALDPHKNISQSLKRFGVTKTDDSIPLIALVVNELNESNGTNSCHILDKIDGKLLPIESLTAVRDDSLIDEIYSIKDSQNESSKWDLIISRIATKDLI